VSYKPIPIPPDFSAPDITIGMAMWYTGLSHRKIFALCSRDGDQPPVLQSYLISDRSRRIVFDSVKRYREACIARGPQLPAPPPASGKRKPGRPKKPRPEQHAPSAERAS
jgi:hypothetical protein